MKRIFTYVTILIAGSLAITACQKYTYAPSMAATIGSLEFSTTGKTNVTAHVDTFTRNPQLVTISGNSTTYTPGTAVLPNITLVVPNTIGTHIINPFDSTKRAMIFTAATGTAGSPAVSGQIVVLNIKDGRIQGNFTFTCADGTTVTNGKYLAEESFY